MKPIDFIQSLQTMGLLSQDPTEAKAQLNDAAYVCDVDLGSGLDGDMIQDHAQRLYQELGGVGSFSVQSKKSEPVQQPRTIAAGDAEPVRTGAELVPIHFDESILPTQVLDEIETVGQQVEDVMMAALRNRLSRISVPEMAIRAIDVQWGNDRGAA